MKAQIYAKIEKEISSGFNVSVKGFVLVEQGLMAVLLRQMVASEYQEDDGGCDCLYDPHEGIICIGGIPGWWDSRKNLLLDMLSLADRLDGNDYTFDYAAAVAEATAA